MAPLAAGSAQQHGAVAVADGDDALHFEGDQGLAERGAADAEFAGEFPLGGQPVTGGEFVVVDVGAQLLDDDLVEPGPGHRTKLLCH